MNYKTRVPWIAALLTFICPGLGHLYNGHWRWTLAIFVLTISFSSVTTIFFFDTFRSLFSMHGIGMGIGLIVCWHAYRQAKFIGATEMKRYQSYWAYLLYSIALFALPDGFGTIIPTRPLSFQIPSQSMVPTLLIGDRLIADGWSFWGKEPKRGTVVVFKFPKDPEIRYVKRLIGLPGDSVEVRKGKVILNGVELEQKFIAEKVEEGVKYELFNEKIDTISYTIQRAQAFSMAPDYGPTVIPEGKYFFLGDNRDRSNDSRFWGFVDRSELVGRMQFIFFSWDKEKSRVRTDRFGMQISN